MFLELIICSKLFHLELVSGTITNSSDVIQEFKEPVLELMILKQFSKL